MKKKLLSLCLLAGIVCGCMTPATARADFSMVADAGKVSGYARETLRWAVGEGLVTGKSGGPPASNGMSACAETAVMLAHFLTLCLWPTDTQVYEESGQALSNPLIGYAPPARDEEACEQTQLVYIGLTWAQWEPREGEYAVDAVEEYFNIARWKGEGKQAVLRFVCDIPGDETHMDIPEWLYEKTRDGVFYDTSYGKGYSPDYSNGDFREAHARAIKALAEYCNQDDFVAYVELGSLGHWGEWHTNSGEGVPRLPDARICWEYVRDYSESFRGARLLQRRSFELAAQGGLGLYNDMTGHPEDTELWLDWIENGGSFKTEGAPLAYEPMPEFWKNAPCGGEFTSSLSMEAMLGEDLSTTLDLLERSHMSFIGPHCPSGAELDLPGSEAVLERLGYRFYIPELSMRYSLLADELEAVMIWENTGVAPIYWDWPATLYVYDSAGVLRHEERLDFSLTDLLPGESLEVSAKIPFGQYLREGFRVGIGISDPEGRRWIRLAMESEALADGIQVIYTYQGR